MALPRGVGVMDKFIQYMRIAKLSEVTISDRVELLRRLVKFLDVPILDATPEMLVAFQGTYAHLAPASVHIYTRHVTAFYRFARRTRLITIDPAIDLDLPRIRKGRPHPTSAEDLKLIFACATGRMRTAYILATFAGLRCGEICRLNSRDLDLGDRPTAVIHGKGDKIRIIPLLPPVVAEIAYVHGQIIKTADGRPVRPPLLSADSTRFLQSIGVQSTLHSMRHTFATTAVRLTHDTLLVRDLLGHESVATTEVYMQPDSENAHERLADFTGFAAGLMRPRHLALVKA